MLSLFLFQRTMTEATEQLKAEISDQYLKDFKDEL